ncbi:MAG: hypothetical protein J6N72_10380 [Psychrobacter sp.]|nr:hypothetical protein [Psychrobacter sp.]
MTTFTAKTENFLANHTGSMTRKLAETVIDRYGSEAQFLKNYSYVVDGKINCGIHGFLWTYEMVQFFTENEKLIIDFAKDVFQESGYSSVSEMVKDFGVLNKGYTVEEVAEGLFDKDSKYYYTMAEAMVFFVGEELARIYADFLAHESEVEA